MERKRLQLLFTFFEEGISKLWELFQNSLLSQQGVEFNSKPNQEELHDIGLDPSWVCASARRGACRDLKPPSPEQRPCPAPGQQSALLTSPAAFCATAPSSLHISLTLRVYS